MAIPTSQGSPVNSQKLRTIQRAWLLSSSQSNTQPAVTCPPVPGRVLGACTGIQENTFPGGSKVPALPDWLQTAKAALSPAGGHPNREADHPPQRHTSPWKLLNRSGEFIRILKAPFIAAAHNMMKSRNFYFRPSPVKLISSPRSILPTARFTQMKAFFTRNSKNTETTIISDFRLGLF